MTELALVKLLGGVRATVFAALLALALATLGVQSMRLHLAQDTIADAQRDSAASAAAARAATDALEAERSAEVDRIHLAAERGRNEGEKRAAGVLAAVDRGDYVLRDKFRCPAAVAAEKPGNSGGIAQPAAPAAELFSRDDVRFLVRFAAAADRMRDLADECSALLPVYAGPMK